MGSDMIIAADSGGSGAFNIILLLAVPLVFYFLLIRPQSKRRRDQLQMQRNVQPGVRVLTTSGMQATVVEVDDDGLLLEIAPDVEVRFVKAAVMQVLDDKVAGEELDLDEDDEDDDDLDGEKRSEIDLSKAEDAEAKDADAERAADEDEDVEVKAGAKAAADKPSA